MGILVVWGGKSQLSGVLSWASCPSLREASTWAPCEPEPCLTAAPATGGGWGLQNGGCRESSPGELRERSWALWGLLEAWPLVWLRSQTALGLTLRAKGCSAGLWTVNELLGGDESCLRQSPMLPQTSRVCLSPLLKHYFFLIIFFNKLHSSEGFPFISRLHHLQLLLCPIAVLF